MNEETVTVKITKQFIDGKPTHWWVEVTDIDGEFMGAATAPSFPEIWDEAFLAITKDSPDWDDEHNPWVDFDANEVTMDADERHDVQSEFYDYGYTYGHHVATMTERERILTQWEYEMNKCSCDDAMAHMKRRIKAELPEREQE